MEKKIFKTVDEVAEYLQKVCYSAYLETDCHKELENIDVVGMRKLLPEENGNEMYDIEFGLDKVVAIFATENRIEYIWKTSKKLNYFEYEVRVVDNEEIGNAIAEYPEYVKNGGWQDVSIWLMEEFCDIKLSFDYEVMTTFALRLLQEG